MKCPRMKLFGLTLAIGAAATSVLACPIDPAAVPLEADTASAPNAFIDTSEIVLARPFAVHIEVCSDAKTVDRVDVDATMPAHQHGMNYQPEVTKSGPNAFEAAGLVFHMPGRWELTVAAHHSDEVHRYKLDITVE